MWLLHLHPIPCLNHLDCLPTCVNTADADTLPFSANRHIYRKCWTDSQKESLSDNLIRITHTSSPPQVIKALVELFLSLLTQWSLFSAFSSPCVTTGLMVSPLVAVQGDTAKAKASLALACLLHLLSSYAPKQVKMMHNDLNALSRFISLSLTDLVLHSDNEEGKWTSSYITWRCFPSHPKGLVRTFGWESQN